MNTPSYMAALIASYHVALKSKIGKTAVYGVDSETFFTRRKYMKYAPK